MEKATKEDGIQIPEQVKVKSLYKAIQLLFYFAEEDTELGVTELAEKSGLLKSSVHNMLSTYEECGLVKRNPVTNKYHLGVRVLELSNQFYRNNDVRHVVGPYMKKLANSVGEAVYLAVPNGTEVIYLDGVFPSDSAGGRNMTGLTAPLYCTGIGKAILANSSEQLVRDVLSEEFVQFTPNTIMDEKGLREELDRIRRMGYSIDNMEHEYGIRCVAVPLRNSEGRVVAAWSISGPSLRMSDERLAELAMLLQERADMLKMML